jgi:hypothetical protein
MRNNLLESLILGCGIALAVLLIQILTQGTAAFVQLLALLAAGVVLFCIQLVLALRRAQDPSASDKRDEAQQASRALRQRRRNPFARELTHDWIGLEEHSAERDQASPYAADALDDELWGEPPDAVVRKSAAKLDDQR